MLILDKRTFVKLQGHFPPQTYTFLIKEMCRAPIPTILVTLDDEFFGQFDSQQEAQDEINDYTFENNMIEVVF